MLLSQPTGDTERSHACPRVWGLPGASDHCYLPQLPRQDRGEAHLSCGGSYRIIAAATCTGRWLQNFHSSFSARERWTRT
jgi:hypothetical protein